jgi:dihydrofolate reductase / thymidylate synthase
MSAEVEQKPVHFIFAVGENGEFGYKGNMPWKPLGKDMKYFKRITQTTRNKNKKNAVIMGRNTYQSIPVSKRPLEGRFNVVLTRSGDIFSSYHLIRGSSLEYVMNIINQSYEIESVFIIGGISVFNEAMRIMPKQIDKLYLTKVHSSFEADIHMNMQEIRAFFPHVLDTDQSKKVYRCEKQNAYYSIHVWSTKHHFVPHRHEEYQYLDLIQTIFNTGTIRADRTGVGTIAIFGHQMKFSLRNGTLPLITTKQTFFRGIAEELLWFISGKTNAKLLSEKGIKIWDANSSKEFLASRGLHHLDEGDIGAGYSHQWRHFGAKYTDMHADYTGQGIDQLAECIHKIKHNPSDRRIVMTAWNPVDLPNTALPPCHMFCQFFVDVEKQELSCQMYQRSGDAGLGIPFNIASYALLTHMIAHVCHLKPGDFIHTLGDTHVYLNHIEPLKEQLKRSPFPFPTITLDPSIQSIDEFRYEHIKLHDYKYHPRIHMNMAV